jgi:hypothetical protein
MAQIGSRLVDMAAQKMAQDFFANFTRVVVEKYPPAVAPAPAVEAPKGFFARVLAWLRRLFGG